MIDGLFEAHLRVSSLTASMRFYGEVLGLTLGLHEPEREAAFYWVGRRGTAMLGLWQAPPERVQPQHLAFRCPLERVLNEAQLFLADRGLEAYNFLRGQSRQPMVFAWMPALAIYFKDPDEHELELIAMLPGEPRPQLGVLTYADWTRRPGA